MLSPRQLFLLNTAQTSTSPRLLEIERAEGMYLYDYDGKSYMDLVSGFAVSNTGHRNAKVVQAIKDLETNKKSEATEIKVNRPFPHAFVVNIDIRVDT